MISEDDSHQYVCHVVDVVLLCSGRFFHVWAVVANQPRMPRSPYFIPDWVLQRDVVRVMRLIDVHRRSSDVLQVGKSLNVIWLLSTGSLKDPFCLMEVCTAVRQGVPVIPIRLSGTGGQLELPIWDSKAQHRSEEASACLTPAGRKSGSMTSADQIDQDRPPARSKGRSKGERQSAASRRRELDAFYTQLTCTLPKATQQELHRNRFSVRDVIAATRYCFDNAGGLSADLEGQVLKDKDRNEMGNANSARGDPALDGTKANKEMKVRPAGERGWSRSETNPGLATKGRNIDAPLAPPPLLFDPMVATGHQALFKNLLGASRETTESGTTLVRSEGRVTWNWERLPKTAEQTGRMRGTEVVPWRTDEELSELIKQEQAETDELAGSRGGKELGTY